MNINELHTFVQKVANKVIKEQQFNNTVTGIIESSLLGFYEVRLTNGEETSLIKATSLYEEKSYKKDDYVYLLSTQVASGNNFSTEYFIFGLVSAVNQNFANLSDLERFCGDGDAIFNIDPLDFPEEEGLPTYIEITDINIINAIRIEGVFSLTAIFKREVDIGVDYGLEISTFKKEKVVESYIFNTEWFIGQPFYKGETKQKRIFQLKDFKEIDKIKISTWGGNENISVHSLTLQVGTLLNVINDFSVSIENLSGKTFFNKTDESQFIELKAVTKYGNQILDNKILKYYWFIEDPSIKEGDIQNGYSILGGAGWRCLNEKIKLKTIKENGQIDDESKEVYKTSNDTIKISNSNENINTYQNKIKCVVGYLLANATSDIVEILNFKYEPYNITIGIKEGELPLLYSDETVTIEATFTSQLLLPEKSTISYKWYRKDEDDTALGYFDKDDNIIFYNENTLTVGFRGESTAECYKITDENTDAVEFYCKAEINVGTDSNEIASSAELGEKGYVKVWSTISATKEISDVAYYQYYISEANNVRFLSVTSEEKDIKVELNNTGVAESKDTYTYYTLENGNPLVEVENKTNKVALNWLKGKEPFENIESGFYYLYYTEQIRKIDINHDNAVLRYDDYHYPKILRRVQVNKEEGTITDLMNDTAIEKLNAFNELTDSGLTQGIEYTEENGGDLYINASYIRSGRLEVFDENNQIIFQAGLEQNENKDSLVTIGGFEVDAFSISHKDENSEIFFGIDGLILGNSFEYKTNNNTLEIMGTIKSQDFNSVASYFIWTEDTDR